MMSDDAEQVPSCRAGTLGLLMAAVVIVQSVRYLPFFLQLFDWLYPCTFLMCGLMVVVPIWFARIVPNAASFDRQWLPAKWSQWGWFLGMVFVLLVCGVLTKPLTDALFPHYRFAPAAPWRTPDSTLTAVIYYGITMILLCPIAEELFYRGYIIEQLRKLMPSGVALLIQSVIFALYHLPSQSIRLPIAAFLYGTVFGMWRLKFRSLLPLILSHILLNSVFSIGTLKRQYEAADLASQVGFPTDLVARIRSSPKCQQVWQLTRGPVEKAIPSIIGSLGDKDDVVGAYAMILLTDYYRADVEPYLKHALNSKDKKVVREVLCVVGLGYWPGLNEDVRRIAWSGDGPEIQRRATVTLWELGDWEGVRKISQEHQNKKVNESAKMFLRMMEEKAAAKLKK